MSHMGIGRPRAHIQETLSQVYVQAVAAKIGAIVQLAQQGQDYGVDVTIRPLLREDGVYFPYIPVDCQLKSTVNWKEEDGYIDYDLKVGTYNNLVISARERRVSPKMLILYCLPRNEDEWLAVNHERLLMRRCCYYETSWNKRPSSNKKSVRIRIPKDQLLTPDALTKILTRHAPHRS